MINDKKITNTIKDTLEEREFEYLVTKSSNTLEKGYLVARYFEPTYGKNLRYIIYKPGSIKKVTDDYIKSLKKT